MCGILFYRNKACISLNCRKLENTMLFTTMRKLGGRHNIVFYIFTKHSLANCLGVLHVFFKYRSSINCTRSLDPPHANTEIEKQAFK